MLSCKINISAAPNSLFDCGQCQKCQPVSALNYPFQKDLKTSDDLVREIKSLVEENTHLKCLDPEINKNPDVRVVDVAFNNFLICRIEAKYLEGKAFVKASEIIGLRAKETLAVDEPKLLHYFECKERDKKLLDREIPIFVVWKFDRPCDDIGGITVFQEVDILREIYYQHPNRFYERKTADNDIVDNKKIGVTKKYHYSIKETKPIWELIPAIFYEAQKLGLWQINPHSKLPTCPDCGNVFSPKYPGAKICLDCWKNSKQ